MLGLAGDDAGACRSCSAIAARPPSRSDRRRERAATAAAPAMARARIVAAWSTPDEWPALLERAPLDLRVNVARTDSRGHARRRSKAPNRRRSARGALRLPPDSRVDEHPAFADGPGRGPGRRQPADRAGLRRRRPDQRILDLCAGAGGKSLALAAAAPGGARSSPRDTNRARLSQARPTGPSAPEQRSRRGCSTRRDELEELPTGRAAPTSSWSMRLARAAAPGAAIPKGAGG